MSDQCIDFIVYWVDGGDPMWLEKKRRYSPEKTGDVGANRYRDWDNLKYLFRGIEKFAPWVHKVYFVTDDQIPSWMNMNNPKLQYVSHRDYIPEEYLPTFSSRPIELNFHRLPGLSEQFVVFNDDFFITDHVKPEDFFVNGLPKDIFMEYPVMCGNTTKTFSNTLVNMFNLIGKYNPRKEYKKRLRKKIISPKYGAYMFYNLIMYLLPFPWFFGLLTPHFARPYLKCAYEELWEAEGETLDKVCRSRFRDITGMNIYVIRLWNLMKGRFVPGNIFKMGKAFIVREEDQGAAESIQNQRYKLICINDECSDESFARLQPQINAAFESILPEKSSFEL